MNRIEYATNKMNELHELSAKYQSYRAVQPSQIKFRDPQNDAEKQIASKASNRVCSISGIVTLGFVLMTIFAFVTSQYKGAVLSLIMTIPLVVFFIYTFASKPQIAYGRAVWKRYKYGKAGKEGTKSFYVSVVFDEPEAYIVREVQTTRQDYDMMFEGTPVMMIKKGTTYSARLYQYQ